MKKLIVILILFAGCKMNTKTDNKINISVVFNNIQSKKIYVVRPEFNDGKIQTDTIASADIADQKATLTWQLDEPSLATIVLPDDRIELPLVLEPGNLRVLQKDKEFTVLDGSLNEKIVNKIKTRINYQKAIQSLDSLDLVEDQIPYNNKTSEEKDATVKKYRRIYSKIYTVEKEFYTSLFQSAKPVEQALILTYKLDLFPIEKCIEEVSQLEKKLNPGYTINYLKDLVSYVKQEQENKSTVAVGKMAKDFAFADRKDKELKLNEILSKNKLTLLEFWASWCGPCRAEIPNLKAAYKEFHHKGFEILSYSIDDKKEDWLKASDQEKLFWIDAWGGDKGWKSPAAQLYFITGVPANFLIDQNGVIVATDLRGLDLKNKLKTILH